jgi:hypothetical protein
MNWDDKKLNLPSDLIKEIDEISEKLESLEIKLKEFGFFNGIQDMIRTEIKFPRGYIRKVEDLGSALFPLSF